MIRPLTFISMILAAVSGLYLYQTKYRSQMLDRKIEQTIKSADAARERIGLLRAEWAVLNEPDRLATLAAQNLTLQPLVPQQFSSLADAASRLPVPLSPSASAPDDPTLAQAGDPASVQTAEIGAPDPTLPEPPLPPPAPEPTSVAAATPAPNPVPRPVANTPPPRVVASRPPPAHKPADPMPRPVYAPVMTALATAVVPATRAQVPVVTSALGASNRVALAPPVPMSN